MIFRICVARSFVPSDLTIGALNVSNVDQRVVPRVKRAQCERLIVRNEPKASQSHETARSITCITPVSSRGLDCLLRIGLSSSGWPRKSWHIEMNDLIGRRVACRDWRF